MRIALYVIAGAVVLDALAYIRLIGKPHEHTTAGAVLGVLVAAAAAVIIVMAAGHLR